MQLRLGLGRIGNHYNFVIVALCFLITVGSTLYFNQGSVAFDAFVWTCTVCLVGAILGSTVPRFAHLYLLFVIMGYLVVGTGFLQFASVILLLVSSWCLGVLVLEKVNPKKGLSPIGATEALLVGASIWIAIWSGMLHYEVNYQSLHIILCLLPCLLLTNRYPAVRLAVLEEIGVVQDQVSAIPFWAWVAGLAIIGWVLRWASFPSMFADDHALHLRVWTELLTQHRYSFDVSTQIWSVAPMTVDVIHAVLSLMAGSDARSALNLGVAILLLLLMAGMLQALKVSTWAQWLLIVLMASTPLLGNQLLTLQSELMLSLVALAGMRLVMDSGRDWRGQHVIGVIACAALCASIKLQGAVLGMTILAALAVRWWSQRDRPKPTGHALRWSALMLIFPLGFVAFHSYGVAWNLTGNPVFPLYNAIFLSPFYQSINFSNSLYDNGFSLASYVGVFFDTSEFFESGDYTAGWQYLILLPIGVLALLSSRTPSRLRTVLIPVLGFGVVVFAATQYWRYLFPVMPLAVVLLGSLFIQEKSAIRVTAFVLAFACIGANLWFFTRICWMMNSPASIAFTTSGKETLTKLYAPVSLLSERVNQLAPGSRVLYPSSKPHGATLQGTPIYLNWYQPFRDEAFRTVKDLNGLRELITNEKVDYSILEMSLNEDFRDVLLRNYMSEYGYVEGQSSNFLLYRIGEAPVRYRKVFDLTEAKAIATGTTGLLLPVTAQGVMADADPKVLAVVPTHRARQARYSVEFICPSNNGYFVAQINWDKGAPYYRPVACETKSVAFVEALPIPVGATQGLIYITAREETSIQITKLSVEVN